jgi:hypothetical protein
MRAERTPYHVLEGTAFDLHRDAGIVRRRAATPPVHDAGAA